jgi:Fic family protein
MAVPHDLRFSPRYRRYTPEVATALMRIAASLGEIRGARVLPAVADQLRASARVGTVHYSNLIEGNELPVIEAARAARGELSPDTRAKMELVNYVAALDFIDERVADRAALTPELLKTLHGVTTRGLGRDGDPHFEPRHEGAWRDGVAVVVDRLTGQVMHEGPPASEVPERMQSMFEWLAARLGHEDEPPYILAGVMHYGITDVHPFADGNGRVARLFQVLVLMLTGALPGRMFSFERYYAEDRGAYYGALRSVRERTFNMEFWLQYFLIGLVEEYARVAAAVEDLSALVGGDGGPLQLSVSQQRAVAELGIQGRREFTRREYEQAANLGRSAAGDDLRELVQHGVVRVRGAGSGTRYAFAAPAGGRSSSPRGRPPRWSDAVIERDLREFVASRGVWPSRAEFEQAGAGALYTAASRRGGIGRWRKLIGY